MLLEKWQENEKHLREKGYKSTKLNKWNYQWYALKSEKPYNHPPFHQKEKKNIRPFSRNTKYIFRASSSSFWIDK